MIAPSLAACFLGILSFVAYLIRLRRETGVRAFEARLGALEALIDKTNNRVDGLVSERAFDR